MPKVPAWTSLNTLWGYRVIERALIWSEQQIPLNGSYMFVAVVMTAPETVSLSFLGNHMYLYPVHLDKGPRLPAKPAIAIALGLGSRGHNPHIGR